MKPVSTQAIINILNASKTVNVSEKEMDTNLTELGMDSMTFIQIIVSLEEEFDCEIPDSKLLITEMDTINKIFYVLHALYEEQSPTN